MPWDSEEPKKLTLSEAVEMLNECGTNINSQYEAQVLDLINKAVKRLNRYENIQIGVDVGIADNTAIVISELKQPDSSHPLPVFVLTARTIFPGEEFNVALKNLLSKNENL